MKSKGVTFVVIAKNEASFIGACIESLVALNFLDKQIILVNSNSDDDTLSIMLEYKKKYENIYVVNSYQKGPAAARNCGAALAEKEFIFFIDGDVEIQKNFFDSAFKEFGERKTTCAIAGKLAEKIYDVNYKSCLRTIDDRYNRNDRKYVKSFGGIFIVKREVAVSVGQWDESLICHEDTDYALRMRSFGRLVALPEPMGIHNTVAYEDRMLDMLRNGYFSGLGLFIKKYLTQPVICLNFVSGLKFLYPSYLSFLIILSAAIVDIKYIYMVPVVILADMLHACIGKKSLKSRLLVHYIAPIQIIRGLLGFTKK